MRPALGPVSNDQLVLPAYCKSILQLYMGTAVAGTLGA